MPMSYKKRYAVEKDESQSLLAPNTKKGFKTKQETRKVQYVSINQVVYCPFCLFYGNLNGFLINTKKGFHKSLGLCRECNNKMQLKSLTADWTIEEYAEWCFNYAKTGFWQKVPFSKWSGRLKKCGWSTNFWSRYKELKSGDKEESPDEYYIRIQTEAYELEQQERNGTNTENS